MVIRFTCPSCNQPLEVDDAWAGQSVACPYCRRVVTAPSTSTWPAGQIPTASPASTGSPAVFTPPLPPGGYSSSSLAPTPSWPGRQRGSQAVGAFLLAVVGMLIAMAGYLTWLMAVSIALEQKVGQSATRQQQDVALRQMLASGEMPSVPREAVILFIGGSLAGALALIFSIRSLLRQEPRRGLAIAALVLSASIVFCQALPMLAALATRSATRGP